MNLFDSFSILKDVLTLKNDNNVTSKFQNKTKKHNIKDMDINDMDIYNSNKLYKNVNIFKNLAKRRIEQSRDPRRTGIINPNLNRKGTNRRAINQDKYQDKEHFGNVSKNQKIIHNDESDSDFSDEASVISSASDVSVMGDPTLLLSRSTQLVDNRAHELKIIDKRSENRNSYLSQFEPMKFDTKDQPVSMNAVHKSSSTNNRINIERDIAMSGHYSNYGEGYGQTNDMSYGVSNGDFTHNNMVPQFKSKSYGSQPHRDEKYQNVAQRKVELFSGSESIRPAKTETTPLFDPVMNATNIYGLPVMADFTSDRYIPGYEKRNELPFQQKRITPGLNLGYNEENPMGDDYRPVYKSIDELRTADKAQISYTTPVVTAGLRGERGPVIGEQKKYRPERTKEWGTERMVKNYGYAIAPSVYGEVDVKNLATVNRGLSQTVYVGPAQNEISQVTSTEMREQWDGSLKQNYKEADPRNLFIVEGQLAREDEEKYIPDPTQRSQTLNYKGPAGTSQIGKTQYYNPSDVPNPTLRDIHNLYDRDGVAITANSYKGHAYDPNDVPEPTLRDVHNIYDREGKAITGNILKGHTYDPNDVPEPTRRDIHNKYDREGKAITGNILKGHAYDPNDVPDVTKREIHSKLGRTGGGAINVDAEKGYAINYDLLTPDMTNREMFSNLGRTGGGATNVDADKGYAINYDLMTPDVTKREMYSKLGRTGGGAANADTERGYTINYDLMTPDVTKREMHSKLGRTGGGAANVDTQRGYTINYDLMTPDVTKREMYSKLGRTGGGATNVDTQKGYTINYDLMTPDVTKREMYSKLGRTGGGAGDNNTFMPRTRADYENAQMNVGKEMIEIINRPPTYSNYAKGPTADFTMLRVCDKIQINRAGLPSTIAINDKLPFIMSTSDTRNLENIRIDSHTKLNLEGNPYINNIIHKAI
jgi:hypothetical protein